MIGKPIVFLGAQGISSLGLLATSFAIDVWVFQATGSYTTFATLALIAALPAVLASPVSGILVDKVPRGALLVTCDLAALLAIGIGLIQALTGAFSVAAAAGLMVALAVVQTARGPAVLATVSIITDKKNIARISGLEEAIQATCTVVAPVVGAAAYNAGGLAPIFLMSALTFAVSSSTVLFIGLPMRHEPAGGLRRNGAKSLRLPDLLFGFKWIVARPHLRRLLVFLAVFNLGCASFVTVYAPLVLSHLDSSALGITMGVGGSGLLLGGVLVAVTGGIRPYHYGIIFGALGISAGVIAFGLASAAIGFAVGAFLFGFLHPVVNAASQILWRRETPPEIQGRVFSIRRMISWGLNPVAIALSIPLSIYVFSPALKYLEIHHPSLAAVWGQGQAGYLSLMLTTIGVAMIILVGLSAKGLSSQEMVMTELAELNKIG